MNFATEALGKRTEPMTLAGDKFRHVNVGFRASILKDSFELHDEELGRCGDLGSNFNDFLKLRKRVLLFRLIMF